MIWSQLPGDGQLSELDVNAMLRTWHDFEDYVLLRRELMRSGPVAAHARWRHLSPRRPSDLPDRMRKRVACF